LLILAFVLVDWEEEPNLHRMANDVFDILDVEESGSRKPLIDTKALLSRNDKKKNVVRPAHSKRPGHIPREVWGLQNTFKNELPPLLPSNEEPVYKQPKIEFGSGRIRKWKWVPFKNAARKDNLELYHWRREGSDATDEYDFARLNKHIEVPTYTDTDYKAYLQDNKWNQTRTAHLMDLARQFDVRFIHMHDRWDTEKFPPRPAIEEMKARYYGILAALDKIRGTNLSQGLRYDIDHEILRRKQLNLLHGRSKEEVEEEERLVTELERIETRRRVREKKQQDLQKILNQAEQLDTGSYDEATGLGVTGTRRGTQSGISNVGQVERRKSTVEGFGNRAVGGSLGASLASTASAVNASLSFTANLTFHDLSKTPGVHLNSQGVNPCPPATKEIVEAYNRLRSNILLLYDLRGAQLNCDYDLQSAKARLEHFAPDKIPARLANLNLNPPSGSSAPAGVDVSVLAALKAADSKRPAAPKHAFGHAGSISAAFGTAGVSSIQHHQVLSVSPVGASASPQILTGASASPNSSLGTGETASPLGAQSVGSSSGITPGPSSTQRRKRAAAAEQGRVMKKLKTRGHLFE
uniref:DNA methyltransferase 1-associated protein 1 n=1 Tax=Hymenolepis diminuta TaxID=6216 RepID=A0A158QEE4_HYMDI